MKTLRQISEKYKITRQGLVKRIDKIPKFRQKYMTKHKGMWLIENKAIHLINHKRQMVRPKHYKQSIDHVPTRYDFQQALKHERTRNDELLKVIKSQQKTIRTQAKTQANNQKLLSNKPIKIYERRIGNYKKHGRWYRFWHNIK